MTFETLIQQPDSVRNETWEAQFLDGFQNARIHIENDGEPKPGPDGWPYLHVKTSVREGEGEPCVRVIRWLAGRGIGLVVNSHKMMPDYVFTYGMLWHFCEFGRFILPPALLPTESPPEDPAAWTSGPPSDKYLPPYVRSVVREFLSEQGFPNVRVLVFTTRDYKHTDLAFAQESLGALNAQQQKTLAEAIGWFLPLHYSVVIVSEKSLPSFRAL